MLIVELVGRPDAALVNYLNPSVVTGVERHPHGERSLGVA
jgi:hypothetical protein